jgi:hypothetical protein
MSDQDWFRDQLRQIEHQMQDDEIGYAVGGSEGEQVLEEYGVEPCPGGDAMNVSYSLADVLEDVQHFRDGRIVKRHIVLGAWEYVPKEDLQQ